MEASEQAAARLWWGTEVIQLYAGQTLKLGRGEENDMVLDDPKVSRAHAILEWNGTGFTLRDLGSVNGTFVNEQRLASAARLLRDGDQLLLGMMCLTYEVVRSPAEPPQPLPLGVAEPLAPAGPRLVVVGGPDMGSIYPLWGETITIGRASREATWEIRLTDRSISRPHARLDRRDEGFCLLDLESANGTQLNGVLLTDPTPLKNGDMIAMGETRLVFYSH